MSLSCIWVYCLLASELGNQHLIGQILHEDSEQLLCMPSSRVAESDIYVIWSWYGVTRQLRPPLPGIYKSYLHILPVFHKKKKLQDSWWAVIILQPLENNADRKLHCISIIYSCLDSPPKSQTAFCHLLYTYSGKIASPMRSLQARHTKNIAREEEAHAGLSCLYLHSKAKKTVRQVSTVVTRLSSKI